MADFSGIGAFGEGALKGYNQGLSNYATIDQIMRAREAEKRATQAQALQTLLQGTQLTAANPDVAESAMNNPAYGLNPAEMGPGIEEARRERAATARLNAAIQSGNLDSVINDPDVGNVIGKNIKVYGPMIKELNDRKMVDQILAGPGTPQEKTQALLRAGVKVDAGLLNAGYPELKGAEAEATAFGTSKGQLPLAEALSRAKAVGQGQGELVTAGPLSQAKRQGELTADLSPDITPSGVPVGGTNVGRIARERETEADRTRKLRGPASNQVGPKDISASLSRINSAATAAVTKQLSHIPKDTWVNFNQAEQQQIVQYLTNQQALALSENDPVAKGQIKEMPRPAAMDKFEAKAQEGDWWQSFKNFFVGDSTPQQPVSTPPRTLRQPAPAATGGWGKAEVVR